MRPLTVTLTAAALALAGALSGCGYTLQNSRSELLEKEGIRTVYVEPLLNNTFSPGVENLVYNSLIREISAGRRVRLVKNKEQADAVLHGAVDVAESRINAYSVGWQLEPTQLAEEDPVLKAELDRSIAREYLAALSCNFNLSRTRPVPGQKTLLWTATFNRSRPFPAANRLGVQGTTSALINDSEFDRALADLSRSMMADVHESMLAMF